MPGLVEATVARMPPIDADFPPPRAPPSNLYSALLVRAGYWAGVGSKGKVMRTDTIPHAVSDALQGSRRVPGPGAWSVPRSNRGRRDRQGRAGLHAERPPLPGRVAWKGQGGFPGLSYELGRSRLRGHRIAGALPT